MKLRMHTAFFKIPCMQIMLSFAISVAHSEEELIITCMFSGEILFGLSPKGLQTISEGTDALGHERNFLQIL